MNFFPNFDQYGYQIKTQLGCNTEGGRITWKGENQLTKAPVVIKQFCFANSNSSWSGYKAYAKELKILQQLNHHRIPQYLDSFETKNGFCLVQEYVPASQLSDFRSLTAIEIKQISLELLEILIYLQQQNPPILHRDIKPENILLDDELKVYLVDFGFASLDSEEISGSSVFQGTPGFIAPEQIIKPTLASDLYSLGVTIVCILSNKNITEIRDLALTDNPYQLNLKSLLPPTNRRFLVWLEKMTHAKVSKRFANALIARDALLPINLTDYQSSKIPLSNDFRINSISNIKAIVGILAIACLSSISVWGINSIDRHVESNVTNIAIAMVTAIVVGVVELSAIEIAKIDNRAKLQGAILAIGVPILLVGLSSLIWGIEAAVDMAAIIVIAEIIILSYFWWHTSIFSQVNATLKLGVLLTAMFAGISLGLNLT